jgi:hypothetical protein
VVYDSAWFLKAILYLSRFFFLVIFGAIYWRFSCGSFDTFLFGIWWGMYAWTLRGYFPCDSPPKSVSKGAQFWGFPRSWKVVFLVEILQFLLVQWVLVDQIIAMGCPWSTPIVAKVWCESMERIGKSGFGFGWVDPRVAVHPECPDLIGMTSAPHRSDQCKSLLGFGIGEGPGVFPSFPVCCCFKFGLIGAWEVRFLDLGFPGKDQYDRCVVLVWLL